MLFRPGVFIFTLFFTNLGFAGNIITNKNLSLTEADVKDVFTGEKLSAGDLTLKVVDNKTAIEEFCQKVLGLNKSKYTSLWAKKAFQDGIPFPKIQISDSAVIEFVKFTPGSIGYINGEASSDVRKLMSY